MHASRYQEFVNSQLPFVLGLALFACVGLLTEQTFETQRYSNQMTINIDLRNDLYTVREKIDQSLSALVYRSLGLTAYVQAKSGQVDQQEVMAMLAALHANSEHVRNFGLAKGTRIAFVYPEEGNTAALGIDYRDVPVQWPDVLAAINTTDGVLTGPVELMQGGEALIFRMPVRVLDEYWGLLSTVIDLESYLSEIAATRLSSGGSLSIRTVSGDTQTLLYGEGNEFQDPRSQRVDVSVPGGHWELSLSARSDLDAPLISTWRLLGWLLGVLSGVGVTTILYQRRALQRLALVDELTGVANRRQFDLLLERFCDKYNRRNSGYFVVLYLDLDKFKEINDEYGHRAGDHFLIELAKRARVAIRGGDLLARWGGDEFAIILDNPTQSNVTHVVDRVRSLCEQPVHWRNAELKVGASIGVVQYPEDGLTPEELVSAADQKMYADKGFRQQAAEELQAKK
ncbi:MAG: diguanylate cyclase (GGDEF)-like protein [Candidatus Azotimanducaceae bacterium]|jgi:diguanylate cyclase (GGDEF)-like protein